MRYVYRLLNVVNNKVYVGQTKNPAVRKANHFYAARKGSTIGRLYAAMRKHGFENFLFEIIEECEDNSIDEREQYWVLYYDSFSWDKGYNATKGGQGTLGRDLPKTPEHRQHMRESQERYWIENPDDQRRKQLAERNKTDEARQASKDAQERRWAKWHAENPTQPKQLLSHEERSQIASAVHKGLKYKTRKDKGTSRGPLQSSITCRVCGRTMKFITHTHLAGHNMTRQEYEMMS